jgi:essential nuclear protein 1
MPRVQKPQKPRHDPLHVEIEQDSSVRQFGRVKPKRRDGRHEDDEDETPGVSLMYYGVFDADDKAGEDARMSRKILDLARDQQEEIAKEVGQSWADEDDDEPQGEPYVFSASSRDGMLMIRSRRPRQVIDDSDDEQVDEEGEFSGGEDLDAEFVSPISPARDEANRAEHRSRGPRDIRYASSWC